MHKILLKKIRLEEIEPDVQGTFEQTGIFFRADQKIQSEIDELHKKFDVLQSQSATLSELNSVRRELNIAYEKLRKN